MEYLRQNTVFVNISEFGFRLETFDLVLPLNPKSDSCLCMTLYGVCVKLFAFICKSTANSDRFLYFLQFLF